MMWRTVDQQLICSVLNSRSVIPQPGLVLDADGADVGTPPG
jgi:hypothetical protein